MWKKSLTFTAAALMLAGCSSTSSSTPAPQPVDDRFTISNETAYALIDDLWGSMSIPEKQNICMFYLSDPAAAWTAFNAGAKDNIPRNAFVLFFDTHC